jgi:hypothetical protein
MATTRKRTAAERAAFLAEEALCATQTIGESLYNYARDHTDDPAHEIETAETDGSGTPVTPAARKYARELLACGDY